MRIRRDGDGEFRVAEVAELADCSTEQVRRWILAGSLPASKMNDARTSPYVIKEADLFKFGVERKFIVLDDSVEEFYPRIINSLLDNKPSEALELFGRGFWSLLRSFSESPPHIEMVGKAVQTVERMTHSFETDDTRALAIEVLNNPLALGLIILGQIAGERSGRILDALEVVLAEQWAASEGETTTDKGVEEDSVSE